MRPTLTTLLAFIILFSISELRSQEIIAVQDFDGATPEWSYTTSIDPFDDGDDYYGVAFVDNTQADFMNFTDSIFYETDLNSPNGTSGFAYMTFNSVDVSTHSGVTLSFDFQIGAYNANDDDARYEVFYDDTGQGIHVLVDGEAGPESNEGNINVNVPSDVNSVYVEISIRNNGGGFSSFDNFEVVGTPANTNNCVITTAGVSNIQCNDNGTPFDGSDDYMTFDLTPEADNTPSTTYNASAINSGDQISPNSGSYGNTTSYSTQGSSWSPGDGQFPIELVDADSSSCTLQVNISDPGTCDQAMPSSVVISEVADPGDNYEKRFVEICNRGNTSVDVSGWLIRNYSNGKSTFSDTDPISSGTMLQAGECIGFEASQDPDNDLTQCVEGIESGSISGNGDDVYTLYDGSSEIDYYGVVGTDGSGEQWEYEDAIATRNGDVNQSSTTFDVSQWTILSGNSTDITPCEDATVMPVQWIDFTATKDENTASLTWTTAEEINNDFFEVQHSVYGNKWKVLGRVEPHNSLYRSSENTYKYLHNDIAEGNNFYRIRQVDLDGAEDFSIVRAVFRQSFNKTIKVFPNPATSQLFINEGEQEIQSVSIVNSNGRTVKLIEENVDNRISLDGIQSGLYFFRAVTENGVETQKLIIQ